MTQPLRRPGEPELVEGTRLLDRYTIIDPIGSGGMATIYRATDDRLDRLVCVKLLRTTFVEGSGSTSGRAVYQATYTHFLKEALALSKLSHPNTLRIYDFGYLEDAAGGPGRPFHVSEYLDGGNLETHVRLRGAMPPPHVLTILEDIAEATAEAHEHGILHRDIKPSNILFARIRGELVPKLADFGIAHSDVRKRFERETDRDGTSTGTVALFSPRWAAPEQLCGAPEGPPTDVYALGLVAAFMLAGTMVFDDDDVRTTFDARVRNDDLVVARLQRLRLPSPAFDVLLRGLRARSEDRIATPPAFVDALRDVLDRASDAPLPSGVASHAIDPLPLPAEERSGPRLALAPDARESLSPPPYEAPPHVPPSTPTPLALRYVDVHEKLDLAFADDEGGQVRLRVTVLPGPSPALNVKGLTCFVARRGGRPTPALTAVDDGTASLVSTSRQILGELAWAFGRPGPHGHAFVMEGREVLIPYGHATQIIALKLSGNDEIVVMGRR